MKWQLMSASCIVRCQLPPVAGQGPDLDCRRATIPQSPHQQLYIHVLLLTETQPYIHILLLRKTQPYIHVLLLRETQPYIHILLLTETQPYIHVLLLTLKLAS